MDEHLGFNFLFDNSLSNHLMKKKEFKRAKEIAWRSTE